MVRLAILLIPLLCSCKPNAETITSQVVYEEKTTSFTKEDDSSPLGYWETNIILPKLSGDGLIIQEINNAISQTATEFQCEDNKGDKQFESEVTLINKKFISLKFSDSWYCAGMPNTQGRTGALTYSLQTGKPLEIEKEIAPSHKNEFNQALTSGLQQALKAKQVDEECPAPTLGYFYLAESEIVFINNSNTEETIQCEAEFKLTNNEITKYLKEGSPLL